MSAVTQLVPEDRQQAAAATEAEVLVLGAGPAGLATAACLQEQGLSPLILEQSSQVGVSWRGHYDRLHLHTARTHSGLPGLPLPASLPTFPSRDQFVGYLDDYAESFDLETRFGTRVTRIRRGEGSWEVHTDRGLHTAACVVVATGYNRVPRRPAFPGLDRFPGPALHSSEYSSGRALSGKRVLVIGCGNSGAEIALDLHEHGAWPDLVVRSPIHVTPREVLGRPTQVTNIRLSVLPVSVADFLARAVLRWTVGDLRPWGIERPSEGPNAQIWKYGRVPLIDVGTIDRIKDGSIGVRPGVERIEGPRVHFADGGVERYEAIVMATGYTTGLAELLDGAGEQLNERGQPGSFGGDSEDGLYFVGFRNPPTGALREIAREASAVARSVRRRLSEPGS